VITTAQQVDRCLAEDWECVLSSRFRGIIKTIAFYPITCVDEEEVAAFGFEMCTQVRSERDVVTPVSAERRFAKVASVPAVGVGCVEKIDVAKLEISEGC